jgi:hypothetical protein
MECHLPKETQQIDRVMEAFAKRYHESNPDLFSTSGNVKIFLLKNLIFLKILTICTYRYPIRSRIFFTNASH